MTLKIIRNCFVAPLAFLEKHFDWPLKLEEAAWNIRCAESETQEKENETVMEAVQVAVKNIYSTYMLAQYRSMHWRKIPFVMEVSYSSGFEFEIFWDRPVGHRETHKIFSRSDFKKLGTSLSVVICLHKEEFEEKLREYLQSVLKFAPKKEPNRDSNFLVLYLNLLKGYEDMCAKRCARKAYKRVIKIISRCYEEALERGIRLKLLYSEFAPECVMFGRYKKPFWFPSKDNPKRLRGNKNFERKLFKYVSELLVKEAHFEVENSGDYGGAREYVLSIEMRE